MAAKTVWGVRISATFDVRDEQGNTIDFGEVDSTKIHHEKLTEEDAIAWMVTLREYVMERLGLPRESVE